MASFGCSLVLLIAICSLLAGRAAASDERGGLRRSAEIAAENTNVDKELRFNDEAMEMTWIEPAELPLDILQEHSGRDLAMMGCGTLMLLLLIYFVRAVLSLL